MTSIVEELDSLLNPVGSIDPEDDIYDDSKAKLVDKNDITDTEVLRYNLRSRRKLHIPFDEDPKYTGKIISRKKIDSFFDDEAEEDYKFDAEDGSDVDAEDGSDVDAEDGSDVDAEDGSDVDAEDGSDVDAEDGSDVDAEDGSDVDAEDYSDFKVKRKEKKSFVINDEVLDSDDSYDSSFIEDDLKEMKSKRVKDKKVLKTKRSMIICDEDDEEIDSDVADGKRSMICDEDDEEIDSDVADGKRSMICDEDDEEIDSDVADGETSMIPDEDDEEIDSDVADGKRSMIPDEDDEEIDSDVADGKRSMIPDEDDEEIDSDVADGKRSMIPDEDDEEIDSDVADGKRSMIPDEDDEEIDSDVADGERSMVCDEDDEEIDSDVADGLEDETGGVKLFSSSTDDKELKRKSTKHQLSFWDDAIEMRIKMQKLLNTSNRMPVPDNFQLFLQQDDNDIRKAHEAANNSLISLQETFLQLQETLLKQLKGVEDLDDSESLQIQSTKHLDEKLTKRNGALRNYRLSTLKYWYDKTRLTGSAANKSFDSLERPTNNQISHILSDQDRLIKRTQLKRSNYQVVGESRILDENETNKKHDSHLQNMDCERFDDDDFYQQILRQLIESKTASKGDQGNEVEMTRQWLKVQRLQNKAKKVVDTKASKGRRVRYHVHSKLVSFMAPCDHSTWSDGKINQMSRLLFGKEL